MNLFINKAIGHGNSGVEHAQFYRANCFRKLNVPFKIVLTDLLPELHVHMQEWHLSENEVISLYDYFLSEDPNNYLEHGQRVLNDYSEDIISDFTQTQRYITRQSTGEFQEQIIKNKKYSESRKLWIVDDDRIVLSNGVHNISWHYESIGSLGTEMVSIHLNNFMGNNYFFATFSELLLFFYRQLQNHFHSNCYFLDRGVENEEVLFELKRQDYDLKIVEIVHAAHLVEYQGVHPLWNNYYQYMFDHLESVDMIITATKLQRDDIRKQIPNLNALQKSHIVAIPVGGVPFVSKARHWSGKAARFVTASRLHAEKHIDQIILAIKQLRDKGLNATLAIYGAGAEESSLKQLIIENHLQRFVTMAGLSQTMVKDLGKYDAFVSASYSEGFGLTYIEAIANALPCASYNNLYGAQELIKDQFNGCLADFVRSDQAVNQNINKLANAMQQVFDNYDKLSKGAQHIAEEYKLQTITQKWGGLLEELS